MVFPCAQNPARATPIDPETRVRVAPAPVWVAPLAFPRTQLQQNHTDANPLTASQRLRGENPEPSQTALANPQQRVLLEDRQINGDTNEDYLHETRLIATPGAAQSRSVISVNFDPSSQYLTFHWARVWRGATPVNYLEREKIKITPLDSPPSGELFTGAQTASLPLDDVRTGDIIDYAYTLRDESLEAKGGKFSTQLLVQSAQPIQQMRARLIWPANRLLYIKNHQTQAHPLKIQKGDNLEFIWNFTNLPPTPWEPQLPTWFDPQPSIQLSGFQSWSDVNRWALNVFSNNSPATPALAEQINLWRRIVSPEDRVLAVLRFSQEEVANQNTTPGADSRAPNSPSEIFTRRSGNCQDKVVFLTSTLRALGIDATPVLVNTRRRQTIRDWHPAADVFDRAIVHVILPGQGNYWLDPSNLHERGPLSRRSWPDYGLGLIVRPGTTALTAVPTCEIRPKTTLTEFWRINAVGHSSELRAVTLAENQDAVRLRARFANTKRDQIESEELSLYANLYPKITRTQHLTFSDDEQNNQVTVTEFYSVDNLWTRNPDELARHCRIFSHNVSAAIQMPASIARTMPLGLDFPQDQLFRAEIEWTAQTFATAPEDRAFQNPAFYFHRGVSESANRISFSCEFATLTDSVPPEMMASFARQLSQVTEAQDYILYSP
jgi:hypothetical protein